MAEIFHTSAWRLVSAFLPLGLSALLACMGVPMMGVPAFRLAELNENLPTNGQSEELTTHPRLEHARPMRPDQRRSSAIVATLSRQAFKDIGQSPVMDLPGHRLANGLLAPITC